MFCKGNFIENWIEWIYFLLMYPWEEAKKHIFKRTTCKVSKVENEKFKKEHFNVDNYFKYPIKKFEKQKQKQNNFKYKQLTGFILQNNWIFLNCEERCLKSVFLFKCVF